MPTSQTIFASWLRTRIAPGLRERGFSGNGQDFHHRVSQNWQVVNFQRSAWGSADETTFTINLGTASVTVMIAAGVDSDVPPREYVCHWRTRIGGLFPADKDIWWTIRSTADDRALDRLAIEVGAALVELALPELDRRVSDAQLLAHVLQDDSDPRAFDIVGPLLRELGPPERFAGFRMAAAYAVGKLGLIENLDALLAMVASALRQTACYAAIASVRLSDRLNGADLERVIAAIRTRHADAVGHDRPLLGHLLRELGVT